MSGSLDDLRIVFWDLETLPDLDEAMKVWPSLGNFPGLTLKASISSIICFGYKIHGQKGVRVVSAWDFAERWEKDVNDDYEVCKHAYEVLKNADVIVTHNGKRFDWKFLNTRLIKHGFPPLPRKIIHIDTKAEAKKHFFFFNNRLDTITKFLTDDKKLEHEGWDLWVNVRKKVKKAMNTMVRYNAHDVRVLEKIFVKLRPHIHGLPNANGRFAEKMRCPNCGSLAVQKRGWLKLRSGKVKQRLQCMEAPCGSWSAIGPKEEFPKEV